MNKPRNLLKCFCLLFLLSLKVSSAQNPVIIYSNNNENIRIENKVEFLEDKDNKLSVNEALRSNQYISHPNGVPNFGLTNSTFWIKFSIKNVTSRFRLLLELSQPTIDFAELYTLSADSSYTKEVISESRPFSERYYKDPNYVFALNLKPGETGSYLIKLKSSDLLQITLSVGSSNVYLNHTKSRDISSGIYVGIMLVMFLYNLFIYFSVRDKSYLYYVIYIFIVLLTQINLLGLPFQYLWPNSPWWATHSQLFFPCLVGIAAGEFMRNFLHTSEYKPRLIKLIFGFYAVYGICIVLTLFDKFSLVYQIMQPNALWTSLFMLYIAQRVYVKGYRPALFFLIAWSIFLLGVIIFVIKDFGVLPYNEFTRYTMQWGSAIEVILLSFGLADRINILKKEKEASQAQALKVLKENEVIVRGHNIILEKKVKERTEELQTALDELKQAQTQLVDAEKMASLGQLTAGIAHEINNPINFVLSNIKSLHRDINEVLIVINKLNEITPETDVKAKLEEINKLRNELDTDYLVTEIDTLLKGIDEGAARTSEIVKGLRNFSRLDEDDIKRSNVNIGIESTLTLLVSSTRDKIKVTKKLGEVPDIDCYPGKLNQVFMNIMNNAIQAINEKGNTDGELIIATSVENEKIKITIKDNGVGIPDNIKSHIFEPFFTTKEVGVGTGLGLSIAYGIIEKHKGQILVESEQGVGTEFTIILPIT